MIRLARTSARSLVALFLLLACIAGVAQPATTKPNDGIVRITLGQSVFPLNGPWKFIVGDSPIDPATHKPLWAKPDFDDSHWETVDLTSPESSFDPTTTPAIIPGWRAKGHPGYSGYAWYRIRVQIDDAAPGNFALLGPTNFDDCFQFFANGVLLGSIGDFSRPEPTSYPAVPTLFPIQKSASTESAGQTQVLAFRFWMQPYTPAIYPDGGGLHDPPQLGQANVVAAIYRDRWMRQLRFGARQPIEILLFLLTALLAMSLSVFDRSDKVYYWIAGVYTLSAIVASEVMIAGLGQYVSISTYNTVDSVVYPLFFALWLMVWWVWFGLKQPAWIPKLAVLLTLPLLVSTLQEEGVILATLSQPVLRGIYLLMLAVRLTFFALLITVVALGARRQGREGWVVLPAVLIEGLMMFRSELIDLGLKVEWTPFGVFVNLHGLEEVFLMVALFVLLLRRMLLSVRAQRELALDIRQAQEVQQVILPESRFVSPGLLIETEYRAARKVGGDFFQIIPHPTDGSLLIVAGDVTGKGLQAGMTVALLIGAVRSTAELTPDPLAILEALNRRLIGRKSSQATCLALSVTADGSCTLANAGHLPPYLNGSPLDMEGALPLGMIDGAAFSVMHFHLNPNDKLVMISDGILEATDANGTLFGFDRVAEFLQKNTAVKALADAAQLFGQNDDISLVALTRTTA